MAKAHTIEDHLTAITTAVEALEAGELPLEEALKKYEQGLIAVRQAKALLDKYAARIEELRSDDRASAGDRASAADRASAPATNS